jgi:ATP-independent RNA helicase DbpA
MLDMGFQDDIMTIIKETPPSRQSLLFSATYPKNIKELSRSIQKDPKDIRVKDSAVSLDVDEYFILIELGKSIDTLFNVLAHFRPESSIVFCNTKKKCQQLEKQLRERGFACAVSPW